MKILLILDKKCQKIYIACIKCLMSYHRKCNFFFFPFYSHLMHGDPCITNTFPSGSARKPIMSLISVLPNLPSDPVSLRPVKVLPIFQNLICPAPANRFTLAVHVSILEVTAVGSYRQDCQVGMRSFTASVSAAVTTFAENKFLLLVACIFSEVMI
jgi:hypothetical protein